MRRRIAGRGRSRAKIGLLAVIFVPSRCSFTSQFRSAYEQSQELLLRSVRDEGRVITQSLLPLLETADTGSLPELGHALARFAGEVTTIKLLLSPASRAGPKASITWPRGRRSSRATSRPSATPWRSRACSTASPRIAASEMPFSLIYHRPTGGAEIVTAVTPLATPAGCWAVVASFSGDAFPSAHLGQPYWATPTVRIAALIYLVMAVLTFSTF